MFGRHNVGVASLVNRIGCRVDLEFTAFFERHELLVLREPLLESLTCRIGVNEQGDLVTLLRWRGSRVRDWRNNQWLFSWLRCVYEVGVAGTGGAT